MRSPARCRGSDGERCATAELVLAEPFAAPGSRRARLEAALELALDFHTWRALCGRGGLSDGQAVGLIAALVESAAASAPSG